MNPKALRDSLDRWLEAGVLDAGTAGRIEDFETHRREAGARATVQTLALAFGGLILTAATMLFVAAQWAEIGPGSRFALLLTLVFAGHAVAAASRRDGALNVVFHAVGTGLLGAAIFLAAQIFHLQAHWPAGILLWAIGAAAAWGLLRQWPQAIWLALLVPAWLWGEYTLRVVDSRAVMAPLWGGLLVTALSYLSLRPRSQPVVARVLGWIGFVAAIPLAAAVATSDLSGSSLLRLQARGEPVLEWLLCLATPLLVDTALRRRFAWPLAAFGGGAWLLAASAGRPGGTLASEVWHTVGGYLVAGAMALGLVAWGLVARRRERVHLGVLGLTVVVLVYYFSDILDRLSRSLTLLGVAAACFLAAWWLRRNRAARAEGDPEPPEGER